MIAFCWRISVGIVALALKSMWHVVLRLCIWIPTPILAFFDLIYEIWPGVRDWFRSVAASHILIRCGIQGIWPEFDFLIEWKKLHIHVVSDLGWRRKVSPRSLRNWCARTNHKSWDLLVTISFIIITTLWDIPQDCKLSKDTKPLESWIQLISQDPISDLRLLEDCLQSLYLLRLLQKVGRHSLPQLFALMILLLDQAGQSFRNIGDQSILSSAIQRVHWSSFLGVRLTHFLHDWEISFKFTPPRPVIIVLSLIDISNIKVLKWQTVKGNHLLL